MMRPPTAGGRACVGGKRGRELIDAQELLDEHRRRPGSNTFPSKCVAVARLDLSLTCAASRCSWCVRLIIWAKLIASAGVIGVLFVLYTCRG